MVQKKDLGNVTKLVNGRAGIQKQIDFESYLLCFILLRHFRSNSNRFKPAGCEILCFVYVWS